MRTPCHHLLPPVIPVRASGMDPRPSGQGAGWPVFGRARLERRASLSAHAGRRRRATPASQPPQAQTPRRSRRPPAAGPRRSTPAPGNPVAVISTSLGDITLELFKDRAPVSVENFLRYANEGFYDGTIFHRVEAGVHDPGGRLHRRRWSRSRRGRRSRTRPPTACGTRAGPSRWRAAQRCAARHRSSTSTSSTTGSLDHTGYSPADFGYAVFGRVLSGMDVVDRIAAVRPHDGDMETCR